MCSPASGAWPLSTQRPSIICCWSGKTQAAWQVPAETEVGTLTVAGTGPQGPGLPLRSDLDWETLEKEVETSPQSQPQMKVPDEMETQLPRDWLA